ncbi:MAG: hypothetical protein J6K17_14010 [Oscillospiraceae bacterium]|nr:hypothetical protein [Oscillospiraceae bacterium]
MKKAIKILWGIFAIGILVFILFVIFADSDATRWRVFSIIMPIAGLAFWGAVILSVIDLVRSKK